MVEATRKRPVARSVKRKQADIIGVTSDGVEVLRPKTAPTHFTRAEIRKTIRDVLAAQRRPLAGRAP